MVKDVSLDGLWILNHAKALQNNYKEDQRGIRSNKKYKQTQNEIMVSPTTMWGH